MIWRNIELSNCAEIAPVSDGDGVHLFRVPATLRDQLNENAKVRVGRQPGGELRFRMNGPVEITWQYDEDRGVGLAGMPVLAEVFQGEFFVSWMQIPASPGVARLEPLAHVRRLDLLSQEHGHAYRGAVTRVLLPYAPTVRIHDITGDVSPPAPGDVPEKRYLAYGSSITNGATAVMPSTIYTRLVADALGVDLINLGFGGGAHLEAAMADYIAARDDWDFATLELGINVVGAISVEEFRRRLSYFIPTIAAAHPTKKLFCIDMFTCGMDLSHPPAKKADEFRKAVKDTVDGMANANVVHLDGRELLGDTRGLTQDLTHPSPAGFRELSANLSAAMAAALGA